MGKLIYSMMASLDGFINDDKGDFNWGQISPAVHRFAEHEQARSSTTIYGRRMYETMAVWEKLADNPDVRSFERDFAIVWRNSDKIVVSRTLNAVESRRTRLVRELTADDIAALKTNSDGNISISGPTLASHFMNLGLVDEIMVYAIPVLIGSGTPMFQNVKTLVQLERLDVKTFENGVTFTRYSVSK